MTNPQPNFIWQSHDLDIEKFMSFFFWIIDRRCSLDGLPPPIRLKIIEASGYQLTIFIKKTISKKGVRCPSINFVNFGFQFGYPA